MKTESVTEPAPLATRVALHPFLAGMSRTHLALLTDCAIAAHFEKGQTILRKGEFAKGFYLIESGEVVLESGEESGQPVVVDTIGPGNSLGWSWMFPPYVWRFTARAVEPIDAIFFYGTTLREYCEKDHSLGYELLEIHKCCESAERKALNGRSDFIRARSAHGWMTAHSRRASSSVWMHV